MCLNLPIDFKFINPKHVKKYSKLTWIFIFFLGNISCSNQFTGFANRTTDESLLSSAQKHLRNADYGDAIAACSYMSDAFIADEDVAMICASAYAGRCGYSFMGMVDDLSAYATAFGLDATLTLFEWYITQITSTAQQISDCSAAESIIRNLGAASTRTNDQNAFMTLLSLRTIALIADETADANNDGARDGDVCATITAGLGQSLGSAFWELDKSLDELATNLPTNDYYPALDTIVDNFCTALLGLGKDLCGAASPLALGATELHGARSVIKEGLVLGVDQCTGNAPVVGCSCP